MRRLRKNEIASQKPCRHFCEGDKIVGYAVDVAQQEAGWIANEIAQPRRGLLLRHRHHVPCQRAIIARLKSAAINANLPPAGRCGTKSTSVGNQRCARISAGHCESRDDLRRTSAVFSTPSMRIKPAPKAFYCSYADDSRHYVLVRLRRSRLKVYPRVRRSRCVRDMMAGLRIFIAKEHDTKPSGVKVGALPRVGFLREELQRLSDPQGRFPRRQSSQLQSVAADSEQNTPDATLWILKPRLRWLILTSAGRTRPGQSDDDDPAYG